MGGFAYLFERFPSLTQTFCYREVIEMVAQGMAPKIYSIRVPEEAVADVPGELLAQIQYLPPDEELTALVKQLRHERNIPRAMNHTLRDWSGKTDKHRVYAAAWLGPKLREAKIRHVHAHFAGIAARTAYWLKKFYGITFSFTGHANDIFVDTDFPVSLSDLMEEARFVATETDFSRDWLVRKFPQHAAKTFRVYNGITVPEKAEPLPENATPRILSVGRYIEKKGFPILIEACAQLRDRGVEFECDIVGGGPMQAELESQVTRLSLDGKVRLPGSVPNSEVRRYFSKCDVFALPCMLEKEGGMDNLPTVIVEAMAHGRPVISTGIAGVPEMIIDGKTGYLAEDRSPASVAASLEKLLKDRALRQELGSRGNALAQEKFATETTTRSLKHLLVRYGRFLPPRSAFARDSALRWLFLRGMLRL
jgi:colanic acid/amylovoran biosynthesis glycosyltransferase